MPNRLCLRTFLKTNPTEMLLGSPWIIVGCPYLSERGNLRETGRSRAIDFPSSLSSPLTGED